MADKQASPEQFSVDMYFEIQSQADMTKHMGAFKVTDELLRETKVTEKTYLLDVGCGVGRSAVYIARKTGCRIMGVDVREGMIARAEARAEREGLTDQLGFKVADAQKLPFPDASFDVVLSESVNVFVPDKATAFSEYLRVLKPGGYLGITESTWLHEPSPKLVAFIRQEMPFLGDMLDSADWKDYLVKSGFKNVIARTYAVDMKKEMASRIQQTSCSDILRTFWNGITLIFKNKKYLQFYKAAVGMPREFLQDIGYGVYVGRKLKGRP